MRTWSKIAAGVAAAAIVATLAATALAAQDAPGRPFPHYRFGVSAGANLADMTDTDDADMRTGFLVGGSFMIQLSDRFSFQPELFYAQKGVKGAFVDDETSTPVSIALKHDYIEVPLLARWSFLDRAASVRPFILGGPTFGVSASCEAEGSSGGVSASVDCDEFASVNNFEVGGLLGAGLELPVGRSRMTVAARYGMGFSKVFDESDSKNRTFAILVGATF